MLIIVQPIVYEIAAYVYYRTFRMSGCKQKCVDCFRRIANFGEAKTKKVSILQEREAAIHLRRFLNNSGVDRSYHPVFANRKTSQALAQAKSGSAQLS